MIEIIGPALNQWDVGRSVKITNIEADCVHLANKGDSKAVIMEIADAQAKIPDYLLQTGKQLCVYAVKDGISVWSKTFYVQKRERPENYVYEDDQRNYIYELITSAETAVENANQAAGDANQAAEGANTSAGRANAASENANKAAVSAGEAAKSANAAADKAALTAKNLMVIGEAEGANIALDDAIDQHLVGLRIFGKTTQAKTPSMSEPAKLVSAGENGIDIMVAGKNLLQCTAVSASTRGITFTVNSDGTIFANGAATENAYLTIGQVKLHPGTYFLNGDFSGSSTTHRVFITDGVKEYNSYTADRVFTVEETSTWSVRILIQAGQTVYNLRFAPMVRLAVIADNSYERYMTAMEMGVTAPNGLHGIPVSSGGTYTDVNGQHWVCNELDLNRGAYVTRVKKAVLTADAYTWHLGAASQQTENTTLFYCTVNSKLAGTVNFMCDRLPVRYVIGTENDFAGICGHTQYKAVYARLEGVYTLEDFLAWLAENPITIVYEAASYIETAIAKEELEVYKNLHTYRHSTTICSSGSAPMEVEYVMDTRKYIDSMISGSILAATVE